MSISKNELRELCTKLEALELSEGQRRLLDSIVKIAWAVVYEGEFLDAQFDDSFEPGEAAAIMIGEDGFKSFKSGIRDEIRP